MSLLNKILHFIGKNVADLKKNQQRMLVAFHSEVKSQQSAADFLMSSLPFERALLISSDLSGGLPPERAATKLGEEYDLVVFDAAENMHPDAIGVVSGVLRGGGCLLLMLPEKARWLNGHSLFNQHVSALLKSGSGIYYFDGEANAFSPKNVSPYTASYITSTDITLREKSYDQPYRSYDQQCAIETIEGLLRTPGDCCCVLTSGRGRGKSSALGLLSAKLIQKHAMTVLLTAPRLSVAEPVFQRLAQQCPNGVLARAEFECDHSILKFMAPDLLLEQLPPADILLVDEAAVIPVSMLEKLLRHYPRIVFATTTHGYEGTGRGFALKFYTLLDGTRPDWKKIELHQPIRWSINDPLEKWIENLLFLNLQPVSKPELPVSVNACQFRLIERQDLIKNKVELTSVFSLLVAAHYRTSPADFQYLLDSSSVRIYVLAYRKNILGVLVVNREGGFDSDLSTAVYRGERRPRGHLLAQTLCFHGGYEMAASFNYARVMRLAIHPEIQRRGLGSYLLKKTAAEEKMAGMDVIGSSFSATPALLDFWAKAGLRVLRLGFSRDHVTAAHAAVVAKALSADGEKMCGVLAEKFQRNLRSWLGGPLSGLSSGMKSYLLSEYVCTAEDEADNVSSEDKRDIMSFALFKRNYEACMPAIRRWVNQIDLHRTALTERDCEIIQLRLRMNSWGDIVSALNLSGKAEALRLLRRALKNLLESYQ